MTFKSYEGQTYYNPNIHNRFYDEKEWRYIPLNVDNLHLSIALDDYDGNRDVFEKKIKEENHRIQEVNRLEFSVDDISYIFLKEDDEKERFIKDISDVYSQSEILEIKKNIHV